MKRFLFIAASTVYGASLSVFTIFWAANFSRYTYYKGDDFFVLAEYFLGAAYVFYGSTVFPLKKINFFLAMAIPIACCFVAIVIGILILIVMRIEGLPRQNILIYGFLYTVSTLLPAFFFKWRIFRFGQNMK